jgi:guanylate kinase
LTDTDKPLGLLFILVGPGGVGKNSMINRVLEGIDNLQQLPTATTRPMRANEQQGREHIFVSLEEFQRMKANKQLLESQEVHPGRFYGIPKTTVESAIASEIDLIADIEIYGAEVLRTHYPENVILIFVTPRSIEDLERRMRERGDSQEEIKKRLDRVAIEMPYAPKCDYLIVNEDMDSAAEKLRSIIIAERCRRAILKLRAATLSG